MGHTSARSSCLGGVRAGRPVRVVHASLRAHGGLPISNGTARNMTALPRGVDGYEPKTNGPVFTGPLLKIRVVGDGQTAKVFAADLGFSEVEPRSRSSSFSCSSIFFCCNCILANIASFS